MIFVQFSISTHCFLCLTKLSTLIVRHFYSSSSLSEVCYHYLSVFPHNSGSLGQYHFSCLRKKKARQARGKMSLAQVKQEATTKKD